MKTLHILLALVIGIGTAWAQNQEPYIIKDFNQNISKVDVVTSGGRIKVEGGHRNTRVKVFIRSNNFNTKLSQREIEDRLKNYNLEITVRNGVLIATAKSRNEGFFNNNNRLSISFEIETGSNVNTDLKTSGGSIDLANLNGKLAFATSGGSISLRDIKGDLNGSTSGGSIKADNIDADGNLRTSGGSITVNDLKGDVKLSTSGGSLNFSNISGKIKGTTSGGSIKVDNARGDISVSTSGGSIRFSGIRGNFSATTSGGGISGEILSIDESLNLSTSAGTVKVDLPFSEGMDLDIKGSKVVSDKLARVSNTLKDGVVYGRVNGGGKTVKIRSTSSIYID